MERFKIRKTVRISFPIWYVSFRVDFSFPIESNIFGTLLLKFLSLVSESNPVEESSNSSPYHRADRDSNSLIGRLLIQRRPSTTDRSRMKRARARISLFPSTFPSAACKIESIPRSNLRHLLFLPIVLTKENQPSPLELIQPTSEGNAAVLGRRDAIPGMWESPPRSYPGASWLTRVFPFFSSFERGIEEEGEGRGSKVNEYAINASMCV